MDFRPNRWHKRNKCFRVLHDRICNSTYQSESISIDEIRIVYVSVLDSDRSLTNPTSRTRVAASGMVVTGSIRLL